MDDPLFIINKPEPRITESDVGNAYARLDTSAKRQFDAMWAMPLPGRSRLLAAFLTNKFTMAGSHATGCFSHASRFNHSCQPNCIMGHTSQRQTQCYVFRDVAAGEELTFSYHKGATTLPTIQRRQFLWDVGIRCACILCATSDRERATSDQRRTLMCFMFFIGMKTHVADVEEHVPNIDRTSVLVRATNLGCDETWPMAAFMCLADAEGLAFGRIPWAVSTATIASLVERCKGLEGSVLPKSNKLPEVLHFWVARQRAFNRTSRGSSDWAIEKFEDLCQGAELIVAYMNFAVASGRPLMNPGGI